VWGRPPSGSPACAAGQSFQVNRAQNSPVKARGSVVLVGLMNPTGLEPRGRSYFIHDVSPRLALAVACPHVVDLVSISRQPLTADNRCRFQFIFSSPLLAS
jgi:hypothetical protein